jgi:CHRD domain
MWIVALCTALLLTSTPGRVSAQGTATLLGATLSSTQEIPLVETPSGAGGSATVTVSADATEITYTLELTGPFGAAPTAAHIHLAPPGEPGPILLFLCATPPPPGVTAQPCPDVNGGPISGTLTAADLQAVVPTFAEAVAALLAGNTYINVHTSLNPSGEIRGQVGPAMLNAVISSAQEIPAVTTPSSATGSAMVSLNAAQDEITYAVDFVGPFTGPPSAAHIHLGAPGVAGGVIFFLCATTPPPGVVAQACPDAAGGPISGTLTARDIQIAGMTMAQAVDAVLSGRTYINVHTAANLSGEARGQVGLAKLAADLNSAQEVPAVTTPSTASGAAMVALNGSQTAITYSVALTGPFTGAPTAAHIHLGPRGASGGVLFFLCANMPPVGLTVQMCPPDAGSIITGSLTEADIQDAMLTMDDVVDALLSHELYINVHTVANPSGEIRGQIDPEPEGVSFANQVQLIYTNTCAFAGCHAGAIPAANLNLEAGMAYMNLVGQPSTETLSDNITRLNRVEPGAPEMSYLFKKHRGDEDISGQRMPRNNPSFFDVRTDLLEIERRWILEGAFDN